MRTAIVHFSLACSLLGAGCQGDKDEHRAPSEGIEVTPAPGCDMTPIDSKGTLPACAAGAVVDELGASQALQKPLTPEQAAAAEKADRLARERNPSGQTAVDRGFGDLR